MKSKKLNNTNATQNLTLQMLISFILAVVFSVCAWIFIVNEQLTYKKNYMNGFGKQQILLLNQAAENVIKVLNEKPQDNENTVIEEVIKKSETSGSRFWIFGTEENILFFKNDNATMALQGLNFFDLVKEYSINGGDNSKEFYERLQDKKDGSFLYAPSSNDKNYLMSLRFFSANEKEYIIGISTSEEYIMMMSKLNAHNVYVLLFSVIMIVVLLIVVLMYSLALIKYKKQIDFSKKQIKDKNNIIESLSKKLEGSQMKTQECNVYDDLTGVLYSKNFITAFLKKSTNAKLFPFGVVVFRIGEEIYCEDSVLIKVANLIRMNISKNDILAREGNEFILILVRKSELEVESLVKTINSIYVKDKIRYQMHFGMCTTKQFDYQINKMLELAYENLNENILAKL